MAATRRKPLNRERILDTALALVDDEGIEALSMRKLGQALGYEAMSLYNHVANKDDLLDGMLDLVLAEMEPPAPDGGFPAIRTAALSAHEALKRHPWAAGMLMSPAGSVRPGSRSWRRCSRACAAPGSRPRRRTTPTTRSTRTSSASRSGTRRTGRCPRASTIFAASSTGCCRSRPTRTCTSTACSTSTTAPVGTSPRSSSALDLLLGGLERSL